MSTIADVLASAAELDPNDAIKRIVDEAPPITDDAADLLRRLNCPAGTAENERKAS